MRRSKPGQCLPRGTGGGSPVWAWIRLVGLLGWLFSAGLPAETCDLVVIVNPQSGVEQLTKAEVINIFLGRQKKLPSGKAALAVDLNSANAEKQQFYAQLVSKELAEINSYWARLIFSGQGSPPRQAEATDEVLDIVENNIGAIGYVKSAQVNPRVKVVYTLGH
ncbi:MAG: hypothetical protein QG599_3160 [Pseudomonadota bacterium]|nr:hypothetical protein [Pseudomonadota bacterium]